MAERLAFLEGPRAGSQQALGRWTQVTIGRAEDNDVVLDDPSVAPHHCRIERKGLLFQLVDGEASTGTTVNGKRIETKYLLPGDVIGCGRAKLRFDFEDGGDANRTSVQLPRVDEAQIAATAERIEKRFSSRVLRVAHEAERKIAAEGALLLARVTALAIEHDDPSALMQSALTMVRERLPAARGAVVLRGTDGQLAPAVAQRAPDDPPHLRMKIDQDALRAVMREGAARTGRTEGRTWCCAPLRSRAGVRGAIYVDAPLPATDFGELHAQILTAVGQLLGFALDHADLAGRGGGDAGTHRLRAVLDGFAHPTFVLDCDGRVVVCNAAAERLVGPPGERRLEEMVVLDDQLRFVTELGRAQRGEPHDVTVRLQATDGHPAPIQCRLVPLYRADATLDGIAVYARPATRG